MFASIVADVQPSTLWETNDKVDNCGVRMSGFLRLWGFSQSKHVGRHRCRIRASAALTGRILSDDCDQTSRRNIKRDENLPSAASFYNRDVWG
jgi:hypothetical protein